MFLHITLAVACVPFVGCLLWALCTRSTKAIGGGFLASFVTFMVIVGFGGMLGLFSRPVTMNQAQRATRLAVVQSVTRAQATGALSPASFFASEVYESSLLTANLASATDTSINYTVTASSSGIGTRNVYLCVHMSGDSMTWSVTKGSCARGPINYKMTR
jgi:hypothetical protein